MDKWFGKIGFANTSEKTPGVWAEDIKERSYYGDVLHFSRRLQSSDNINPNIEVSNKISIVADPFALNNYHSMRYLEFMGAKWTVSHVDVSYPRLLLILGGVYNGEQA